MKINYSVTGARRKALVEAISKELDNPAKYLGAPTFAYKVGTYNIDRNGMLEGKDNPGLVAELFRVHNLKAVNEEYDAPPPVAGVGGKISPIRNCEEPTLCSLMGEDATSLTIELPKADFTDATLKNLKGLIEGKKTLIKKALGVDFLPVLASGETINFPWFDRELEVDEIKAYTHFIAKLGEMANKLKRVNTTEKIVENEKYAFRCFLLRLGFIGPEYKGERKILLSKLSGSSAFKNGPPKNGETTG